MAAYDYICEKCLTTFEVRASFAEYESGLKVKCPRCGSTKVRRALNSVTFIGGGAKGRDDAPRQGCAPGAGPGCCG